MSESAPGEAGVKITDLPEELVGAAVVLWQETGLTRPWNDPYQDCRRALHGDGSTVLAAVTVQAVDDPAADAQQRLLGTVMLGEDGHRGWIYYLAVERSMQRHGLGQQLLAAAEEWLRARGVPKLMLMVRQENAEVQEFYRRHGYTDQDTVVLGRWLDAPDLPA
ncbi:GNAT family acetyltransferase [Nesterenkonia lutea]|uniref:Ribosomal protein S18 acetylase RimI-like enzyme n=1 Tax=Nesterenkonia lutea TaxID=272919 RepID=A0ABR9JEW9_9MICC|nr:GNAT family acetyltransferase [Nesterenkonia lutea]MBE1524469.1 ribosomal protein S18 acetylase RimI-like enzyme [Nesterenkonia lutea]